MPIVGQACFPGIPRFLILILPLLMAPRLLYFLFRFFSCCFLLQKNVLVSKNESTNMTDEIRGFLKIGRNLKTPSSLLLTWPVK